MILPKRTFALVTLFVLITAVVIWGFNVTASEKVSGHGMMLYGEGISSVMSPVTEEVTGTNVKIDNFIERGQIIACVSRLEILREIKSLQKDLTALGGIFPDGTINSDLINHNVYTTFADLARRARTEGGEAVSQLAERLIIYRIELQKRISNLASEFTANSVVVKSSS